MGRQGETDKGTSGGMPGTEMRGVAAEDCSEREARRLRFTNIQRYTDTEIHGCRDTRIHRYIRIQRYRDEGEGFQGNGYTVEGPHRKKDFWDKKDFTEKRLTG